MSPRLTSMLLFLTTGLFAQVNQKKEIDLERLVDEIYGFQDLELNYEELYENLALLLSNPLNINTATIEQLRFINILTEYQIQQFISYKAEHGNLISVYELQAIPDFDHATITKLVPFIKVTDQQNNLQSLFKRIREQGSTYLLTRYERALETKRGFTEAASSDTRFKGNEDRYYARFRSSLPGDFSFGFTAEKDAGEELVWNPSRQLYGADYISFHAQLLNKGRLRNIIVGDFQPQFGQGITLGGSFGFGKGAETVLTTRRSNLGFLPYTSVNEFNYQHGVAATIEIAKNLLLSSFYSNIKRDATLSTDTVDAIIATSFQTTGFHRNNKELSTRKQIGEENFGMIVSYQKRNFETGLIVNQTNFSKPINRSSNLYNQFDFSGTTNTNAGAYANLTHNNFTFFSEFSHTLRHGNALVVGLLGSLTPKLDVAIHYRNYQRNFYSFYSNAFAEGSSTQNERGLYWGWKYRITRKISTAGYADLFQFPWLRFRSYTPSQGHEWLLRLNYQPSRNVLVYLQVREELKDRNVSNTTGNLYTTVPGVKRNYMANFDYTITPSLKLRTRAQFSSYNINNVQTKGMMLLQDITWSIGKFSVSARHALFDTDDFDNRQYVYERDVWLAYSLPAYSGTGIRNYILLQYDFSKTITAWLRYARFGYTNKEEIGSGVDTIAGNTRNDIKFQIRIRFIN